MKRSTIFTIFAIMPVPNSPFHNSKFTGPKQNLLNSKNKRWLQNHSKKHSGRASYIKKKRLNQKNTRKK